MSALPQPFDRREALPDAVPDRGVLYLAPPLDHTAERIRSIARRLDLPLVEVKDDVVAIRLAPGELRRLCAALAEQLSHGTLLDTRSLLKENAKQPALPDLLHMQSLATLVGRVRADWLIDMLREGRILVYFQPVVSAGQPQSAVGHECLLRGLDRDGTAVHHVHLLRAASDAGLRYQLDRQARLASIRAVVEHGLQGLVFLNVDPSSIYDPMFCLQSLMRAVAQAAILPSRIVVETSAEAAIDDLGHVEALTHVYRRFGFATALDRVGSGPGSFGLVGRLKPDFVKIGIDLVRSAPRDANAAGVAEKVIELAHAAGARVIATGIECEQEWAWFESRGADYAQGFLFAKPATPPPGPGFSPS